jgi:hypothetical protein
MKIVTNIKIEMTRTILVFIFYSPKHSGFFMLFGVHKAFVYSVGFLGCPCHQAKVYFRVYFEFRGWRVWQVILPVSDYNNFSSRALMMAWARLRTSSLR